MTSDRITPAAAVDQVLRDIDGPHVVVGPLVWRPSPGTSDRDWYFIVAASEADRGFRCDELQGDETDRRRFLAELVQRRGPLVAHDMADELAMARLCASLWPGERTAAIARQIEAERRSTQ